MTSKKKAAAASKGKASTAAASASTPSSWVLGDSRIGLGKTFDKAKHMVASSTNEHKATSLHPGMA